MENLKIENDYVEIWLEDGIIYNIYKSNLIINLEIAKLMVSDRLIISDGICRPLFVDISNLISIDMGARAYLSGEEGTKLVKAGAFFTTTPLAKFAGKLFLDVNQPKTETQIFTNKQEAIEWLQLYKNN
jgi:hypothetical protein